MLNKIKKIPAKLKLGYRCIREPYFKWVSPGHFYSALPDMEELRSREHQIFGTRPSEFAAIDLRKEEQSRFLDEIAPFLSDLPFDRRHNPQARYFWPNNAYPYQDAFVLYAMLRRFKPARLIEVGCGLSTCVTLDACQHLKRGTSLTMIDPYPDWMNRFIKPDDRALYSFRQECIQDTPAEVFGALDANDILFIDTSHVSKAGSDVNHIFFQILPSLRPGVLVHFHDIWYPFEYPIEWLEKGMFWNEAYLLRAFLMFNPTFEVVLFNNYVNHALAEQVQTRFPDFLKDPGLSLWLRRKSA